MADGRLPLLIALAACAIVSDLQAMRTGAVKVTISGSFLALIMAMVFLGPAPAAILGMLTVAVGWFGSREEPRRVHLEPGDLLLGPVHQRHGLHPRA